jgi:hypothetical protein
LDLPEIEFKPGNWSPVLEGFLHDIDGIEGHINALQNGIERGDMQALLISSNGDYVGVLIWSIEHEERGAVIVCNAFSGRLRGVDLTLLAVNFLVAAGRKVGAVGLRAFTDRRGLVRKLEAVGMKTRFMIEGRI